MANYTVVKGDSLWAIASRNFGSGLRWTEIADLNGISRSKPIIYPGQVLSLDISGTAPAPPASATTTTVSKANIQYFGLQAGTDTTVFATWTWNKSNTDKYEVSWHYDTGDGIWFVGTKSTTEDKQSLYSAPSNAKKVKFKVKPISKTHTVNDVVTSYWTAAWSTESTYNFADNPPSKPPVPSVTVDKYTLTATLSNLDINATHIQFQIIKNSSTLFNTGQVSITLGATSYACAIDAGGEYTVRARGYKSSDKVYGDWSEYSYVVNTIPAQPAGITVCRAQSDTSIYLEWSGVVSATSYDIEYTNEIRFFESSNETTVISGVLVPQYEKTGLESGKEYFFRVRAVNSVGSSSWSTINSVVIGKDPVAPTTWASSTTVTTGEPLILYWVHNAEDRSKQKYAEVEITTDGVKRTYTIRTDDDEPSEENKTNFYTINTNEYVEGTKIQWRVRTSGITNNYGEWSVQRVVDIYAPPTLVLSITNLDGSNIEMLNSFPFYISAIPGPKTQRPIGYHVSITANETYETLDSLGRSTIINVGQDVYSSHFDINDSLLLEMSAFNVDLENNISYTITCQASMDSGLSVQSTKVITVNWQDVQFEPNAEIGFDKDTYVSYIRPYCLGEDEQPISGVTLSVYRREFDGSFTEIATHLKNSISTFVTDPHPSLDYARYRIVATTDSTGAVSFYDPPGYPIQEKAIIIQWDEEWTSFDALTEDALEHPPWTGSLLTLPYNIDVANSYRKDVALIEYVGREHPVSYYGTQLGETATWSVDIDKQDIETLYELRRLSVWMGDAYVREPSGSGYWAQVGVSFNQTHAELTIPVSLTITRVEGGA